MNEEQVAMSEMILHDEIRRIEKFYGEDAERKCEAVAGEDIVAGEDAGIVSFKWRSIGFGGWTNRRVAGVGIKLDDTWDVVLVYRKLMARDKVNGRMYELAYRIHVLKDLAKLDAVSKKLDRLEKWVKGMVRG